MPTAENICAPAHYIKKPFTAILLMVLLSFSMHALAQQDGGIDKSPTIATLSGTALVAPAVVERSYAPGGEQSKKIKNIITFSIIEESASYIPEDFSATIILDINYGHNAYTENQIRQSLTVNYKKSEGVAYDARKYITFDSAEFVRATIVSVTPSVTQLSNGVDTRQLLLLQNEMRVTCYYKLAASNSTPSFATRFSTPDALNLSWATPPNAGNNQVQLEWTWLETQFQSNYSGTGNGGIDFNLLFKNNASRIDLSADRNNYSVPLFYDGTGKLYYRIRAVSIKKSGSRIDGPWSAVDSFAYYGHSDSLNWQVTTSYAEEGKRKTVIQYYDGSLRSRQTVTRDNVTNTIVTAETLYDGQGRPAIQVLPAPGINTVVAYTKNLNRFNGQADNTTDPASFFDLEALTPVPGISRSATPPMDSSTGAALYYSGANPEMNSGSNKNIPDAAGYPYTVTRYTPDGTGRIMSQSGVGEALKMGSTHETKYYYGSAAQEELDGLFGTEAGNATHYFKNMVQDANGQMSVSYTDMHGRTVATALAGDATSGMYALPLSSQYPNQSGTATTRNLLDKGSNIVKNNTVDAVSTLLVPATGSYTFHYELTPDALQLARCNSNVPLSYDCMYNLEFSITDESGDNAPILIKFNNVNVNADDTISTPVQAFVNDSTLAQSNIIQFSQTLLPGSYAIRKTLTISESSLKQYKDSYLSKALCKTAQQIIDSVYTALLSVSNCNTAAAAAPCQACADSLGTYSTYRTKYLSSYDSTHIPSEGVIHAAYSADSASCRLLCGDVSHKLETIRSIMLSDMVPFTGQYARETDTTSAMYNKYDIFSSAYNISAQPYYRKPWNSNGVLDYYYDADHTIDVSIHPDTLNRYLQLNNTSKTDFAGLFSYSWAESLLPHHPEYAKLCFAEANLTATYDWIEKFNQVNTYSDAVPNYLITSSSFGTSPADPFFLQAPAKKDSMNAIVSGSGYYNRLSLWQIAYGDVSCKSIIDSAQRSYCYTNAPKDPSSGTITLAAEKDQVWSVFKGLYTAVRDSMVNAYINEQVPMPDAGTLLNQGYALRFATAVQSAQQYKWDWYPATPGNAPNVNIADSAAATYKGRCSSYIERWRLALSNCAAINSSTNKEAILTEITSGMVAVCEKGVDAANPYGSSSVNPLTPSNGSPRSFEAVITAVLSKYFISPDQYCNPFLIEFPKPYSKGPVFTKTFTTAIDTCTCSQFAKIKTAASAAGKNPDVLSSLNEYVRNTYNDTLTPVLFNGLQHCSELMHVHCIDVRVDTLNCNDCVRRDCDTTVVSYPLSQPQPLPQFLTCGFRSCLRFLFKKLYCGSR